MGARNDETSERRVGATARFGSDAAAACSRARGWHFPRRCDWRRGDWRSGVHQDRIAQILERTRAVLDAEEHATLSGIVDSVALIQAESQTKDALLERLRRMIFGASTESTHNVLGGGAAGRLPRTRRTSARPTTEAARSRAQCRRRIHRRRANDGEAPRSARRGACPGCASGKLYPQSEPAKLVRITGMAPLSATVYACDRLRCNLCGEVFTAPAPAGQRPACWGS
jgi:transposase